MAEGYRVISQIPREKESLKLENVELTFPYALMHFPLKATVADAVVTESDFAFGGEGTFSDIKLVGHGKDRPFGGRFAGKVLGTSVNQADYPFYSANGALLEKVNLRDSKFPLAKASGVTYDKGSITGPWPVFHSEKLSSGDGNTPAEENTIRARRIENLGDISYSAILAYTIGKRTGQGEGNNIFAVNGEGPDVINISTEDFQTAWLMEIEEAFLWLQEKYIEKEIGEVIEEMPVAVRAEEPILAGVAAKG